jgi:DNA repair exonuclease SbcCD nuclease subunit
MRVTLLHAADLHLDSPLVGLERYEGAPVRELRSATRRAFSALIDLCIEEQVQLLLVAGDLYDGDWRDYSTGLFFATELARLAHVGTRVVWIRGNHDAQSKITRHLALGVHCVELSAHKPETHVLEQLGIAVHGQGFATPAVTEDLAAGYPAPIPGLFNIGLLHTALSGRPGHAPYAPCDVQALVARGYDYWALGHVHQREVIQRDPWIVFPGNLQARHVRESGAKGATLIRLCDGAVESVEHRVLDVVRFGQLKVDVSDASSASDVAELCRLSLERELVRAEGRLLCTRLHVVGRGQVHRELAREPERARAEIIARAAELALGDVWIESTRFLVEPAFDLAALEKRDDAVGSLLRSLARIASDPSEQRELAALLGEIESSLPPELRSVDRGDPELLLELSAGARRILLPRILEEL